MFNTAIIAKRTDHGEPETEEIRGLTEAAGARILGELTQTRPEDPGTYFGTGKVSELAALVAETGVDTVVVDGALTPKQTVNLEEAIGARVFDRHRVVLDIFGQQARTRRAQRQVELASLRYELPRIESAGDPQGLNIMLEKGTRLNDVRDRIDELERTLDELPAIDEQHRQSRRDQGFDLVAIAGYTNAGKTTVLRRLADEMALDESRHDDLTQTAGIENRLFKTLETTTRRATIRGRQVLLTDTVGFLDELPHWLVSSFRGTLREVEEADAVILVVDIAQPVAEIRRTLVTSRNTLPDDVPVVTALNKVDRVPGNEVETICEELEALLDNPVSISALKGDLDALADAIVAVLDDLEYAELSLPLSDEAMSLLSWIHERAMETTVEYHDGTAQVTFEGRPEMVGQATARAAELDEPSRG